LVAVGLAIGGFEAGRKTVDAAAFANSDARAIAPTSADSISEKKTLLERDRNKMSVREIATIPFSQLYDVLKSAPREQLLEWARDLEDMPRGPRQRAAVGAYLKSLVQVDHRAAIEAVLRTKNLLARDAAVDGMMKAAPESIWADVAEMIARMPYPLRGFAQDNLIENWSRVDPVAASRFVEKYPSRVDIAFYEPSRVVSLLNNWGEIDPSGAKEWIEKDPSRQTAEAFRAFLTSWARVDRAAAIEYAIANQQRPNFEDATNELVYDFVRSAKEDANNLLLRLSAEAAKVALKQVADLTNPHTVDRNIDHPPSYQRPPEEVARWMVALPVELWRESIGRVVQGWLNNDGDSAKAWLAQLQPELRDLTIVGVCREAQSSQLSSQQVIEVGLTITDPKLRYTTLTDYLRAWGPTREEAADFFDEMAIPVEQKAYLQRLMTENANAR
jgi:hypothetical protein